MRDVSFECGVVSFADGSCIASFGNTRVLCTASLQEGVPPFLEGTEKGWVTAEYAMLPASVPGGRKRRERDSRSVEIQRFIGRSLRAAVHMDRLGEYTVYVDCDVLQADGGTRTAAISGGWVALYQALGSLAASSDRDVSELVAGQVAAVSVGIVDGEYVLDLDYAHDSVAQVDFNVVMLDNLIVEVQGNGEHGAFSREQLERMLDFAEDGIERIFAAQKKALGLA
ncbi:ribonuclease PH [Spirochaetia bacterium 38H-sp]|uniref:Ribonuclease PH n=1 Tax=Rarispira pelagica TaxID=3141764 RepID=A0ABU9UBU4_9SPIR